MAKESNDMKRTGARRGGSYVVDKEGNVLSVNGKSVGGEASKTVKKKTSGKDSKPQEGSE